jgi:flagellar basal-body rod modification protein FlgD
VTSPISGPTPTTSVTTGTTGASSTAGNQTLDQNAFLKLLVAQMKYQDPSKPMDASQMMAQTATYTQIQKLSDLVTAQQSAVTAQKIQAASAMVGRSVRYTTPDGHTGTGVVASATLSGSEPTLKVGNTDVPLSSVTEVRSSAG